MKTEQYRVKERSLGLFTLFATILMIAGFVAGYLWPHSFGGIVQPAVQKIRQISGSLPSSGSLTSILVIFLNNSVVAITMVVLGIFLGVYPAWVMWMNGVVLGAVSAMAVQQTHAPVLKVIVYAILPHGIFELSALVWAAGLGFHLGFVGARSALRMLIPTLNNRGEGEQTFRSEARRSWTHLGIIIGLLLVAACMESLVTPHLIGHL